MVGARRVAEQGEPRGGLIVVGSSEAAWWGPATRRATGAKGVAERGRAFQRGAGQSAAHLRVRLNHGASDITQSLRPSSASRLVRATRSVLVSLPLDRPPPPPPPSAPSLQAPPFSVLAAPTSAVLVQRIHPTLSSSFHLKISLSLFVRVARCANAVRPRPAVALPIARSPSSRRPVRVSLTSLESSELCPSSSSSSSFTSLRS